MTGDPGQYPPEAYSPDGTTLWWALQIAPDTKKKRFGAERRLAAWLAYSVEVGDLFTMPELREALNDGAPNDDEHLNRRLRKLRGDGWVFPTRKDEASIPVGHYLLRSIGWHPSLGPRGKRTAVSQSVRLEVLLTDSSGCVICGVASFEPYPREPYGHAVMTVGHRVPAAHGGSSTDINNLQAECQRCNGPRGAESDRDLAAGLAERGKSRSGRRRQALLLAGRRPSHPRQSRRLVRQGAPAFAC